MRPSFFPRETHVFQALELSAWRTMSLRVVEMAVMTGLLLRALRAFALTHVQSTAGTAAALALGTVLLLGMLTLHLANFPVRRWAGRVATFALVEVATEMLVSVALIAAHREPLGTTGHASWNDLPTLALSALLWRGVSLIVFSLVLAGIVQLVRRLLPRHVPHHSSTYPS